MKLRWKIIGFLSLFLVTSFYLLLWKSNRLTEQKYAAQVYKQEALALEQITSSIAEKLISLEASLHGQSQVASILQHYHVRLMGQMLRDQGRWRARWQEGVLGTRAQVKDLMGQIPINSLPATRKSWHNVEYSNKEKGYAYIVPQGEGATGFYIFLLDQAFFESTFDKLKHHGAFSLFSPVLGELFSSDKKLSAQNTLNSHREAIKARQQGVVGYTKDLNLVYLFNPDLQLYLFKAIQKPEAQIGLSRRQGIVFIMAVVFIFIAVLVVDFMLQSIFYRVERVADQLLLGEQGAGQRISIHTHDEIAALETAYNLSLDSSLRPISQPKIDVSADFISAPSDVSNLPPTENHWIKEIRPKAISALGHLHKIKSESDKGKHVATIESELRDIRRIMDSAEKTSQKNLLNPNINPSIEEQKKSLGGITIRKPKRAEDESRSL